MKEILEFSNLSVQYWVEEFPQLPTVSIAEIYDCLETNKINIIKENKICVELYLHKNASNYGMLGVEFVPDENISNLEIQIQYTDKNIEQYQSEINKYDKTIYSGLLEEYVPYIKNRMKEKLGNNFFAGSLIVSCATNSEVGSSPKIFCIIIDIVTALYKSIYAKGIINIEEQMKEILGNCGLSVKTE